MWNARNVVPQRLSDSFPHSLPADVVHRARVDLLEHDRRDRPVARLRLVNAVLSFAHEGGEIRLPFPTTAG